jgi:hypothetical protein
VAMDEYELAQRASALPERFADRLSEEDLATISSAREADEWEEEIDNLIATLAVTGASVSRAEQEELGALVKELDMSPELLGALKVFD